MTSRMISQVRAVPRTVVDAGLRLARVPVDAAARATRQQHNDKWAPALAFEGLEANVEAVLGALLRDDTLASRGRLRQARVAKVRKAVRLETVADHHRAQADERLSDRRERAERQRARAAETAAERAQAIERQAERQEREVRQQAATKAAAAGAAKAAQDELVERQAREARAEALGREVEALTAEKQALEAEETVAVIDETIEGSKAAREG